MKNFGVAPVRKRQFPRAMVCVLACAFLPGCQIWNGMLDMMKWRMADKKPTQPVLVMQNPGSHGDQPAGPAAMVPRVMVYRITAPVGTFSTNESVWKELNEDALDSKMSVLMAQNGLRAGTGAIARWPAIAKLIEGPGVTASKTECQTDGHASLSVVTRAGVTDEIVMSIDSDLQQQGRTFDRCDDGFKLSMRGVRNKPALQVQLVPYVSLGTVAVTRQDGQLGVGGGSFASEETFEDLQMGALLSADQFLVVCPTDPKANRFSVGTLWLSDIDKVPAMETVLIFVPAGK